MKFSYDDAWENQWDDMKKFGPASRHTRRLIKRLIKDLEFDTLLDVSCGSGELLKFLSVIYPDAILFGTEYSKSGVEISLKKIPGAQISQLDLTSNALTHKCDLVLCIDILEHIEEDQKAIANLHKMTKNYILVKTIQGKFYAHEKESVGHVRSYTREDLEQKMQNVGFEILDVYEWGFPFYSPIYRELLNLTKSRGTTGSYNRTKKLLTNIIYSIFLLNSRKKGDSLFILAKNPSQQ